MIANMTMARLADAGQDREAVVTAFQHHHALLDAYDAREAVAANKAILAHIDYSLSMCREFMDAAGGEL